MNKHLCNILWRLKNMDDKNVKYIGRHIDQEMQ